MTIPAGVIVYDSYSAPHLGHVNCPIAPPSPDATSCGTGSK